MIHKHDQMVQFLALSESSHPSINTGQESKLKNQSSAFQQSILLMFTHLHPPISGTDEAQ